MTFGEVLGTLLVVAVLRGVALVALLVVGGVGGLRGWLLSIRIPITKRASKLVIPRNRYSSCLPLVVPVVGIVLRRGGATSLVLLLPHIIHLMMLVARVRSTLPLSLSFFLGLRLCLGLRDKLIKL